MFRRGRVFYSVPDRIARFLLSQNGAVTIEWIVLTSAVVMLAAGIGGFLIGEGEDSVYDVLRDFLSRTLERATVTDAN